MNASFNRAVAIVSLAALPFVSACSSDGTTKIDDTLSSQQAQTAIQLSCSVYIGIKAGYASYAGDHKISDKTATIVAGVTAGIDAVCTAPYPASTADLIAKVTQAGVAVFNALQDEKKAQEVASG